MQASEIREKYWSYKGHMGVWKEILPLFNCEKSWIGFGTAPSMTPAWAEHSQSFLPCVEGGYWQDFGWEPGSTLRAPGTGLHFAPLWFCFPPQCSSGSSPWWRSVEQGAQQGYQWNPLTPCTPGLERTAEDTNLGLEFHHGRFHLRVGLVQLTDLLVQLLDLLIVLQNCRREGHRLSTNALGKSKSVGLSAEPILPALSSPWLLQPWNRTYLSPAFFPPIFFIINIFIIAVQWYLNRSICKCKCKSKDSRAVGVQHIPTPCKVDCPEQSGHPLWSWVWNAAI